MSSMTVAQIAAEYTQKRSQVIEVDTMLRALAAQAARRYAGEKARIDRGLVLALNGHVTLHADGAASVQSGTDAEIVYTVNGHCDCPDVSARPRRPVQAPLGQVPGQAGHHRGAVLQQHHAKPGLSARWQPRHCESKRAEEEAAGGLAAIVCGYGK